MANARGSVSNALRSAKGESFDVKSILPPPVPDEENVVAATSFNLNPVVGMLAKGSK